MGSLDSVLSSAPADASASEWRLPELLAPAGDWECLRAAVENGADAIYFGLERFNARMRAENFREADLPQVMSYLHRRGVKGYVTFNTLVFPQELAEAETYLRQVMAAGVDAVIVQDVGICRLIRHLSPDFPIHASTQMTITSGAGVAFAQKLGCQVVVLARECSLPEINRIRLAGSDLPLEVFVHGALCVAYSGQCLTSESLGGRSANRGECAQACRMPYDLIADGQMVDLGDRRYLLSPQDLAGISLLPDLLRAGVASLKIEGRLKSPEYVASVTQVYRQALDRLEPAFLQEMHAVGDPLVSPLTIPPEQQYSLEMSFSRGLSTGWLKGVNHPQLVHARFGKKRGVYLGQVAQIAGEWISLAGSPPLKVGDGVVFDQGQPDQPEPGGRIGKVQPQGSRTAFCLSRHDWDSRQIRVGDRVWKTSDPEWEKQARQSFAGEQPRYQRPLVMHVYGQAGQPLRLTMQDERGHQIELWSEIPLLEAESQPLTPERLVEQLGRLGHTPFYLAALHNHLVGAVILPLKQLNHLRRQGVEQLQALRQAPPTWQLSPSVSFHDLLPPPSPTGSPTLPQLRVLVRNLEQLEAACQSGIPLIYGEFEDLRLYRQAVERLRGSAVPFWAVPPRISKPGEEGILNTVRRAGAAGYLIRNYDHLAWALTDPCVADFSFNVANPLTADYLRQHYGVQRLTASYDLSFQQLQDLLTLSPPEWYEVTIHQHMPMFHMEHCVFCAFLSNGTDHTNCGRPCESQQVALRDRVGSLHPLKADAGCRNTVFNGQAQTAAEFVQRLIRLGVQHFRVEFLNESAGLVKQLVSRYQQLLQGEISGGELWREFHLHRQLGVTRGQLLNR
ncbi:MAG: U32 family peptidase [Cyanobacteriota bacterium]|nr:U32 family peptidase [Cyanobacteriota bacterium]